MKTLWSKSKSWVSIILIQVAFSFMFNGCFSAPPPPVPTPPVRPTGGDQMAKNQKEKDDVVVASADKIDVIVTQDAPQAIAQVREQTDQIRQAVQTAPAADVTTWVAKFDAFADKVEKSLASLQQENARLKKELAEAKDATSKKVQFWFGLILRIVAAGLLLVAGVKVYASITSGIPSLAAVKRSLVTAAFSAAAFSLSWAVAQWWFYWSCGLFVVAMFGLWIGHAYFADRSRGTLTTLAAAIEKGKDEAAGVAKVDLAELKETMADGAKSLIKKIRRKVKPAAA